MTTLGLDGGPERFAAWVNLTNGASMLISDRPQ
jgi:hypothetical protein